VGKEKECIALTYPMSTSGANTERKTLGGATQVTTNIVESRLRQAADYLIGLTSMVASGPARQQL